MMPLDKGKWINKLKRLEAAKEVILNEVEKITEIARKDGLRADENKEYDSLSSRKFFNSFERNNIARIRFIEKQIQSHEAIYNKHQRIWQDYADSRIIAEAVFDETKKEYENITTEYNDYKTKLIIAGCDTDDIQMREIGAKLQTLHYDLMIAMKKFETAERKLNNLKKRRVQELEPLDIFRQEQAVKVSKKLIPELPEALKTLRDAIVKHNSGEHVRNEPKSPNPMDEIIKSFQTNGDSNDRNDTVQIKTGESEATQTEDE